MVSAWVCGVNLCCCDVLRASSSGALYYRQSGSSTRTDASSAWNAAAHYSAHRTVAVCVSADIACTWAPFASCAATDFARTRCSSSLIHTHRTPQSPCCAGCSPAFSPCSPATSLHHLSREPVVSPLGSPPTGFRRADDPPCASCAGGRALALRMLLLSLLPRRVDHPLCSAGMLCSVCVLAGVSCVCHVVE